MLILLLLQAAVEFLLLARQPQQAFDVAQTHGQMDAYVRGLGTSANTEDSLRVAAYYENRGSQDSAAQMYAQAQQPYKALVLYMQVSNAAPSEPHLHSLIAFCWLRLNAGASKLQDEDK